MRSSLVLIVAVLLSACNTTPEYETIDGVLEVPENRQNPDSRTLNLVYKVLKAKKPDSLKAPIVYLQGGPGGATLFMEAFWENHPLRDDRDIVLMDQRGTGVSEANCIESGDAMFAILRLDLDEESEYIAVEEMLSECKVTIDNKRVDLAGYNSRENAADFEDLRKALGYEKWNLIGASYGTRLGLTIMRDFPNSVRTATLIAVLTPETNFYNDFLQNFENSLFSVLKLCEENESCKNRYPNLKERLLKSLKKLQTSPLHLEYKEQLFVLNPQDALLLLHQSLYDRYGISNIPSLIEAFEGGETEPIVNAIKRIEFVYNIINLPMSFSVMAFEELPFYEGVSFDKTLNQQSELEFNPTSFDLGFKLMANWHSYRASNIENQAVVSEIPTLMASGSLDPVTPTSNANKALKGLKNGHEVIFTDDSHDLFNPCLFEITENFLNDPYRKPDLDCSTDRKSIEWNLLKPEQ